MNHALHVISDWLHCCAADHGLKTRRLDPEKLSNLGRRLTIIQLVNIEDIERRL